MLGTEVLVFEVLGSKSVKPILYVITINSEFCSTRVIQ